MPKAFACTLHMRLALSPPFEAIVGRNGGILHSTPCTMIFVGNRTNPSELLEVVLSMEAKASKGSADGAGAKAASLVGAFSSAEEEELNRMAHRTLPPFPKSQLLSPATPWGVCSHLQASDESTAQSMKMIIDCHAHKVTAKIA